MIAWYDNNLFIIICSPVPKRVLAVIFIPDITNIPSQNQYFTIHL